ncbi:AbfB domain-containing protein [Nocardia otitidiscaviarum]|uniref:AbfB domain-containing protein n=1 Tax=Nocardia otitidiscaviarum TaxID=1823 RepID=UPI0018957C54|nr:AbfB domain-containing protein [Nocardia otitidiscaviarum]MBF6237138.1 AbfB domain-containing protein [Nocardia otitidiscaviarum]
MASRRSFLLGGAAALTGLTVGSRLAEGTGWAQPVANRALQSYNIPDMYIRHAFFQGELTRVSTDLDRADATFDMVAGLADSSWVSFRSKNYPNRYLRHRNFRLQLDELSNDTLMRQDATFRMRPGLADTGASSFSAYNSNLREHYIRHRCFSLYLEPISDDLGRRDATFRVANGFTTHGSPETERVVDIVNFARARHNSAQNGCRAPRLILDNRLTTVAQRHSQDLADHPGLWEQRLNGYRGHIGSDGSTPSQRIQNAMGSPGSENVYVAWWFGNATPPGAQAAFDSWWNSPDHKRTLLDFGFALTGVGIATGQGTIPAGERNAGQSATFKYVTQVFHT